MDFKALSKNQQGALIAGAVTLILSFIGSYVRVKVDGGSTVRGLNFSAGTNAWTGVAVLGMLLLIAAAVIVAIKAFSAGSLPDGVPWSLAALAAAALGTLIIVLKGLTAGSDGPGFSTSPGWSGWLLFLSSIALTAFTFLLFKESGEKMPEFKKDTPPT